MNTNKAAGSDDIHPTLIFNLRNQLVEPLTKIFKESIGMCVIPTDWKDANVTPVYKKKGDRKQPGNYRPISLTSQIGKLLEKLVKQQLMEHLELGGFLKKSQHGFRVGRSTQSNLIEYTEDLFEDLDRGACIDVVYMDLQKAFDKVPHNRLIVKLKRSGIGGKLLEWLKEWLANRQQRVCYKKQLSGNIKVLSGVPQGSVLGPTLFLVYINDLEEGLKGNVYKFADDTKLKGIVNRKTGLSTLHEDLKKIETWASLWQMPFNTEKCCVMHLGNGNPNLKYYLNGSELKTSNEKKDLGVLITNDLSFSIQCAVMQLNRQIKFRD